MDKGDILWVNPDPSHPKVLEHNYTKKIMALHARGIGLPIEGVNIIHVAHDLWCEIHNAGYCNCDPDVYIEDIKMDA